MKIENKELDNLIISVLRTDKYYPLATYVIANQINHKLYKNNIDGRTNTNKVRARLKKLERENMVKTTKTAYKSMLSWNLVEKKD